ncbi:iron-containing alcohol dehydrogenase [Mycolicibacterium tokaiense]|uniref:Iron-containing alcohol dehydrogenase n=1 Tax=Mycolicibacterium tokaiense TaxID=39695 RepID=A0A378TCK1_9MYCO|nr:alcohol dehydrogenase [Mycolicibacterium tokaiense]STZ58350.1 iron-containing alcohol dehydrogenase [Mycolicibacterium tokaiense]
MTHLTHAIAVPRTMRIGGGSVDETGDVLRDLGARRPLIVTDAFLVSTGQVERLVASLEASGASVAVYSDTVPDPTTDSLTPAKAALAAHRADSVIGFGGGSPMDTAKALAVLGVNDRPMREFKAPSVYTGPALPIVAIPTTAGSGSEATQFTVITDSATDEKMLCIGTSFLPIAAIIDYRLTLSMPARLTADTGIDALTHAVEAYVSRKANAFSDGLCLLAIRAIGQNIRRVVADGSDEQARAAMMMAATQAGMAFSNSSVALIHGMSRPIGAHFHVAHGLSNAMLFPAVTRYSIDGAADRYADCARAMGLATEHEPSAGAAANFVDGIAELCRDLTVPTPQHYGISRAEWDRLIPTMAEQALASGSPANNPRVPGADDIEAIYNEIYAR